jgi:hypothetical protein
LITARLIEVRRAVLFIALERVTGLHGLVLGRLYISASLPAGNDAAATAGVVGENDPKLVLRLGEKLVVELSELF